MAIACLSLSTSSTICGMSLDLPGADKIAHFLMYGGLGGLLCWAFSDGPPRYRSAPWVLSGAFAYGILMEILQSLYTDGMRAFGWDDILANVVGAAIFWFAVDRALHHTKS